MDTNENIHKNWERKYTPEQKLQIGEFLLAGNKVKDIAEALKIPESTVQNVATKLRKKGELPYKYKREATKIAALGFVAPCPVARTITPPSIDAEVMRLLREENAALRKLVSIYLGVK